MSFLSPSEFYAREQWTSFMSPSELYARERTVDVLLESIRALCQTHSNGCPFAVHQPGAALHTARLPLFIPNSSVQDGIYALGKAHNFVLLPVSQTFFFVQIRVVKLSSSTRQ